MNDHRGPHITNVEVRLARMEARLSLLESLVIRPSTSMPSSSESAPLANAQPANDSLKHASVGVSLSKLEASVASGNIRMEPKVVISSAVDELGQSIQDVGQVAQEEDVDLDPEDVKIEILEEN